MLRSALTTLAALVIATTTLAQTPTDTIVPSTATATVPPATASATVPPSTATATAPPATATAVPSATNTAVPTSTPNRSLRTPGARLTYKTRSLLQDFSPGAKAAGLADLIGLADRNRTLIATNATPLGLNDVTTVTTIEAFTTTTGAPAAKMLLLENIDFTVGGGDITPVGDHSAETWVIHYRP